jgi:hypothetical protein
MQLNHRHPERRGVVLLAVLVVVAILMLVGYQYLNLMNAEHEAVHAANRVGQGRHLADSGLHYVAFILSNPQAGGLSDAEDSMLVSPAAVYDNAAVFHMRPVSAISLRMQGYFSIIAPRDGDDPLSTSQGFRFGVEDESGKININALRQLAGRGQGQGQGQGGSQGQGGGQGQAARDILMRLPNMTEEIANAILNWSRTGPSDEAGLNDDSLYYSSLGYAAKYGPLESLEELLLVRGVTPRLLLGNDLNRNGILEPEEDDTGGVLDPGWARYLTVYSRERNLDSQGQPRIFLNDADLPVLWDKLNEALGEELANFIIGWRKFSSQQQGGQNGGGGRGQQSGGGGNRRAAVRGRG